MFALFALLFTSALFSIKSIELYEPKAHVFEGEQIVYGSVGPGQTFTVQINPIVLSENGEFLGQWDMASTTLLPDGWSSQPSRLYDKPLIVEITTPSDAKEGRYYVSIIVEDEKGQENIGDSIEFSLVIDVLHDVLQMSIEPKELKAGATQPAKFEVTLTNLGSAKDVFTINAWGVKDWEFEKKIYLQPGAKKSFTFEVVGNDEASYDVNFHVVSDSSKLIYDDSKVKLHVHTNLISDYKSTSHGVLLFPLFSSPIYSISGLIGLLFP